MITEDECKEDEYQFQYYGFTATMVHEEFSSLVDFRIKNTLRQLEKKLREKKTIDDNFSIKNLEKSWIKAAQTPLQKFKDEIKSILRIPPNVQLEDYKYQAEQCSSTDLDNLNLEIRQLEKEYETEKLNYLQLENERKIMEKLKPLYISVQKALDDCMDSHKMKSINDLITVEEKYISVLRRPNRKTPFESRESLLKKKKHSNA